MRTIKELKSSLPQAGKVDWIGLRPGRKAQMRSVQNVLVSEQDGLEGDHYNNQGGHRMVTLIQGEHLDTVAAILGTNAAPDLIRRNVVIRGINLNALHDARFSIGTDVMLEGTGYCHPCSRMEENLGSGGYNAMRGHGGITARVVQGGSISVGDEVRLVASLNLEEAK